jgi:hypothetical protein
MHAVAQQDVEHRPWLTVMLKRCSSWVELDHSFRTAVFVYDPERSHRKSMTDNNDSFILQYAGREAGDTAHWPSVERVDETRPTIVCYCHY